MSTKHIRTVTDICRFGASLKITCGYCAAARTLDGFELAQQFGAKPLTSIPPRLKCSRCGKKEAKIIVLPPV